MLDQTISHKIGWTRIAFGDVVRKINDKADPWESGLERYVAGDHLDTDQLRIRRWGLIGNDYLGPAFHMRFKPGHVLYGSRRTYLRKVALADFEGITANTTYVLEARNPSVLMPELLPFIMQTEAFHAHSISQSKGSVNPYVNFSDIACFQFLLPPIDEQARLVETLKASESVTEALYQLVWATKQLRQAAIDHFAKVGMDQQNTLGVLCEMQNGRPFPGDAYTAEGIRLLRPGNLGASGYLSWSDSATKHLPVSFESEAQAFIVDEGDLVINLTAQSLEDGFMGRVCFAREGDKSLLNQRIGRFCSFSNDVLPEFVFRMLQSSRFHAHAIRMCEGSKIKHLFWEHLVPFKVPLLDMTDQHQIIGTCRAIDNRLREAQERQQHALLDRSNLFEQRVHESTFHS